jgi:hypothetical protein
MRKSSERRGRFSSGETHQNAKRENITWTRPGTRGYDDSLNRQRKSAHRSGRGRTKPQAGTSSEQRKTDAIWQSRFPEDRPKGKYEKLQDKKREGQPTGIEAQKQGIIRKGERRRELRTQAVNAIRRAVGGGYVSEAKVDDRLSADQKAIIRNLRLPPGERYPVRGESPRDTEERLTQTRRERTARNRGGQTVRGSRGLEPLGITDRKKYFPQKISARLDKLRAKRAKNNIRPFREEKSFEEFMIEAKFKLTGDHKFPLTPEEQELVQKIRDHLDGKQSSTNEQPSTTSASRRKPRKLNFEVREERERNQSPRPTVLPRSRERDIGKHDDWKDNPSTEWGDRPPAGKNLKRRAQAVVGTRRREDKETGVYEEFKDLTPEKEERVKKRMGELARDIQVQGARMKELRNKPFVKYRPKVKQEMEAIVKSSRKKQNLVQNASDALIPTSADRSAKLLKRKEELKQKLRDLGVEP